MTTMLTKLKKLKGRSLDELRVRSAQHLAALGERYAWTEQARLPGDADLLRSLNGSIAAEHITSPAGLLDHFRARTAPPFFAAFDDRVATVAALRRRWPEREAAVIAEAERAARGEFKLLGYPTLNFGSPVDWHLEPVANKRAPLRHWSRIDYLDPQQVGDKKITWELNRCQHFLTLGQAYWYTGDERHAETFVAQLCGWMDANPPKQGINWASSLEVSFRAIAWLWALYLFRHSPRLTPELFARALKFLYLHARHLETYLSTYFSPNTHLTGEALGLVYLGTLLPEFRRAAHWRTLGQEILLRELDRHVRPDGVYFEQASHYHRYTTDFYTHLLILTRRHDGPRAPELEAKLAALLDHLMFLTRPDGATPLFGDEDGGWLLKCGDRALNDFRATLATGAALFGRGDYKFIASAAAEETLWLLGPEGVRAFDQLNAQPPAATSRGFADGGYYIMRDGWTATSNYLLIDAGPHGAMNCGHAHADALSFEFAAGGEPWLIDPGTYTYTGDARLRDEFRGSAGHNTATVDGESQSVPAGPFAWRHIARSAAREFLTTSRFDYFVGAHNGYERLADPVTHRRAALFIKADEAAGLPAYVVLRDSFTARAAHRYALHYHFDPACRVTASAENELRAVRPSGAEVSLRWWGSTALRGQVMNGRVSRCYGQQEPAAAAACEGAGAGAQSFLTCLLPTTSNSGVPVAWEAYGASGADEACLRVRVGAVADMVVLGDGAARRESELLTACAEMAWARVVTGRVVALGLANGSSLACADGFAWQATEAARACVLTRSPGALEIELEGARAFHLALTEPTPSVIINGVQHALDPRCRRATFVQDRAEWRLSESDG